MLALIRRDCATIGQQVFQILSMITRGKYNILHISVDVTEKLLQYNSK
jgi:hypothetical protein